MHLGKLEYRLMKLFMRNPQIVFSSEMLLTHIWGTDSQAHTDSVWVYISYLRKKLEALHGYRAAVSIVALGANPIDMAVYPNTATDSDGNALSGENKYIIHIDADAFPPTHENGFWSITAYNEVNYLIDNEIDRYAIKNNTPYILNEDGSLDIYVQAEKPTDEKQLTNWLPVSEGAFQLYLRVYLPQDSVLNNEWVMPSILKAGKE